MKKDLRSFEEIATYKDLFDDNTILHKWSRESLKGCLHTKPSIIIYYFPHKPFLKKKGTALSSMPQ